jgi:hypothetical protein
MAGTVDVIAMMQFLFHADADLTASERNERLASSPHTDGTASLNTRANGSRCCTVSRCGIHAAAKAPFPAGCRVQ